MVVWNFILSTTCKNKHFYATKTNLQYILLQYQNLDSMAEVAAKTCGNSGSVAYHSSRNSASFRRENCRDLVVESCVKPVSSCQYIMFHSVLYKEHDPCQQLFSYIKCLCLSLGHAEYLCFSCLGSKVIVYHAVISHMSTA